MRTPGAGQGSTGPRSRARVRVVLARGLVRRRWVLREGAGVREPGRAAAASARPAETERRDEPGTEETGQFEWNLKNV